MPINSEKLEALTNNYSAVPVPDHQLVGGLQLGTIIVGIAITLPAFLIGAEFLTALGFVDSVIAFFAGGWILVILAILTMRVAIGYRLSTYKIIQICFGEAGAKCINILITIINFGWFGLSTQLFGQASSELFSSVFGFDAPAGYCVVLGCALMSAAAIFGFRAIDRLSRVSVPLLLIMLIVAAYFAVKDTSLHELIQIPGARNSRLPSVSAAISILIGAFSVGITILPDMARFLKDARQSTLAALISYGSGSLLVMICAGTAVLASDESDFIAAMLALGLGPAAMAVIFFATLTTNTNILYSNSLSLAQIFPRSRDWILTLSAGVLGTGFALAGIMDYFIDFLTLLSIAIPPIAGIYLVEFYILSCRSSAADDFGANHPVKWRPFVAWGASILALLLMREPAWTISTIEAIDALLISGVFYFALSAKRFAERSRLGTTDADPIE